MRFPEEYAGSYTVTRVNELEAENDRLRQQLIKEAEKGAFTKSALILLLEFLDSDKFDENVSDLDDVLDLLKYNLDVKKIDIQTFWDDVKKQKENWKQEIRKNALAKLTIEEKEALGLEK